MQLDLYPTQMAPGGPQPLNQFLTQRKVFITIDDATEYKRCRVQSNRKGVVLRDLAKGATINTKKQQLCRPGDFLVAEIDAKVGGYGFVPAELDGAIVSSHYYLFEVDETRLLPAYLHYLTQSDIIQSQISSQGSTNYAAIRPKEFLAIEIPYVELARQRDIVARLDELTLEIAEFNRESNHQAALLTRLRQTILREAVQGRLLPQDPTDEPASTLLAHIRAEKQRLIKEKKLRAEKPLLPLNEAEVPYEVPDGWAWCRLGEVISIESNLVAPKNYLDLPHIAPNNIEKHTGQLLPYVSVKEDNVTSPNHLFQPGSLLYSKIRPSLNKATIVDFVGLCSADMYPLKTVLNSEYLLNFILSTVFLEQVYQIENRVKMPKLNQNELSSFIISIPPIPEQQRIVSKVNELLAHCTALKAELQRGRQAAETMYTAALREAFTGLVEAMAKADL